VAGAGQLRCRPDGRRHLRESGVPTFRGAGGLWKDYKPEELATPDAFARDPRLVWEWYDSRRQVIAKAQPNAAHRASSRLKSVSRASP